MPTVHTKSAARPARRAPAPSLTVRTAEAAPAASSAAGSSQPAVPCTYRLMVSPTGSYCGLSASSTTIASAPMPIRASGARTPAVDAVFIAVMPSSSMPFR
ncbi:hypothetical protein ADK49_22835 [Streptomyces sp. WM6349]|nr:hypothetical protein ADK49_22835 [Streptomyces sp. WM6349]KOU98954.1 hypothetical protein ADK91_28970 [Streptomyces sp. XY511]KOV07909.1 hypothetical protein ADK92_05055 [Streptomyces sp. XY533]KOV41172.1 hypothetical protein ADK98_27095 [Streptomyces sp. H036]